MTKQVVGIEPTVLKWARESVGLSIEDVALTMKRQSGEVVAWEAGDSAPTYPQLEKLAYQIYKRPLAIFFLPEPPEEVSPQREFRTLPDADLRALTKDTYLHIRRAHAYQLALKELFGDRSPVQHRIWETLSLSTTQDVTDQASCIRNVLGISLRDQIGWKDDDKALKHWRASIEGAGVFVFKAAFKQKEISGFCLVDQALPLVYLNNSTTKTRQIFSLLHELAHLLLSMNGLSKFNAEYIDRLPQDQRRIEQFCNAVAAEVLIPSDDFSAQARLLPANVENAPEESLEILANRYAVSREAILRRFLDQGRVSLQFYEAKAKQWTAQMRKPGKGNWYSNQGAYLSENFAREVVSRHYRNEISLEKAADFLGIKPKNFAGYEERVVRGGIA